MPGDPRQCRINGARCKALSKRAWRPDVSRSFNELAEIWNKLAAETEADETLYRTLAEIELGEPYEALPRALKLGSRPKPLGFQRH